MMDSLPASPSTPEMELVKMLVEDELMAKTALDAEITDAQNEVNDMLTQINQQKAQLSLVQSRRSLAQSRLQTHQDQSNRLAQSITEKRLRLSPILRLPDDVVRDILKTWSDLLWGCIETNIEEEIWGDQPATPLPIALRVCRAWRDILLGCPRIWGRIPIFPSHPRFELEGLQRWLRLSKSAPLDLYVDVSEVDEEESEQLHGILSMLLPEVWHLQSVELVYNNLTRAEVWAFFQVPLPALKHLHLHCRKDGEQIPAIPPPEFLCNLPLLTHCVLKGTPLPTILPSQLRCLALRFYDIELNEAVLTRGIKQIHHCASLERLQLAWLSKSIPPTARWKCPPAVRFLTCTTTCLREGDFSDMITHQAPLDTFCLRGAVGDLAEPLDRLRDVGLQLKVLTIRGCGAMENVREGFGHQPAISSLTVKSTKSFSIESLYTEPLVLPRLKHLKVVSCPTVTGDEVLQVLRVRRSGSNPAGVLRLESLEVRDCEGVTAWHHHIIDELLKRNKVD